MTIKACVFDMDGTLLNTLNDLAHCVNTTLIDHGFKPHPIEAYRYFVGSGARNLISRALPESARQDALIASCLNQFERLYDSHWDAHTELYPGINTALDAITDAGIPLAILTNKPQAFAELCVARFLSQWRWTIIQGQQQGLPLKPAKGISDQVTNALQVPPESVLYFGDSDVDMHTARNAGYKAIGVSWGFRTEQELEQSGAEQIIQNPLAIALLMNS